MKVYLDNAATTPLLPEVVEVITQSMSQNFGNPSSTHQFGRKAKTLIEAARKNIATLFNTSASQIVFTASGTEANNLILHNAVVNLGVKHIITSKIEHHAVLHTINYLKEANNISVSYVKLDDFGNIVIADLEKLLANSTKKTLVSLMYINNEVGNTLPINSVSELCIKHNALFHSDTVQAIGHYKIDLEKTPIDFITASAHKFHGPKGVGFVYCKKGISLKPMLHGGEQERGMRASTENTHGILGMNKALTVAYDGLENDKNYIMTLKAYFISALQKLSDKIEFNGMSSNLKESTYTILNVRFPFQDKLFHFTLDLQDVAVSLGSACQSGSVKKSHVLTAFLPESELEKSSIRFSFSKLNTKEEIDFVIRVLAQKFH